MKYEKNYKKLLRFMELGILEIKDMFIYFYFQEFFIWNIETIFDNSKNLLIKNRKIFFPLNSKSDMAPRNIHIIKILGNPNFFGNL